MTMYEPGELVVPKLKSGIDKLLLWSDSTDFTPLSVVAEVEKNRIMTVLKFEAFRTRRRKGMYSPEWLDGACLVLGPDGQSGWTGAGWLKRITNDLAPRRRNR